MKQKPPPIKTPATDNTMGDGYDPARFLPTRVIHGRHKKVNGPTCPWSETVLVYNGNFHLTSYNYVTGEWSGGTDACTGTYLEMSPPVTRWWPLPKETKKRRRK